jgi:hypothetical protein
MKLEPAVTVKRLVEAEPGELVRTRCNDIAILALIAGANGRYLITLEPYQDHVPVPRYFPIRPDDISIALSFGKSYAFGFDPSNSTIIDPNGHSLYRTNGVLVVADTKVLLRAASSDPGRSFCNYDIETGTLVEAAQTPDVVFISKWNIHFCPQRISDHSPENREVLIEFTAAQATGQR